MSKINNGGPAFPAGAVRKSRPAHDPGADFRVTDVVEPHHAGMTLRDYFAAKAMQGMLADGNDWVATDIAETAYRVADAMLCARESNP